MDDTNKPIPSVQVLIGTACMRTLTLLAIKSLFVFLFTFFLFSYPALAATTSSFRSASIITTDGSPSYTNLSNCSISDWNTCDRATGSSFGNLYFRGFGSYSDFGIPPGAKITNVRIRVTGKSSSGVYVGLSAGSRFTESCQWPTDLWSLFSSQTINVQAFVTPVKDVFQPGTVKSSCLQQYNFDTNNFIWRINYSSPQPWSANIDNFEIAFDYDTPITPTPTPAGPEPFLDLPWDYEGKSFEDVALNPTSWFDHQYPLQNIICCVQTVLNYTGLEKIDFYRSHNGYDYGLKDGVELNTPVLAAASGLATFKSEAHSGGAGNVIKIDHGNGYQSWYEHLSMDDLIASDEAKIVAVIKGQKIGKVGMTGNTNGPHIHFSVFKDANNNGTFDDDIPYGTVDPLGWEGTDVDPWLIWTDGNRTGTKSFNLFIARAPAKTVNIAVNGGSLSTDKVSINFPGGAFLEPFKVIFKDGPFESASNAVNSVVPSFFLNAIDSLGQPITQFQNPVSIMYNYSSSDLSNINESSLLLYFFNELTKTWDPLATTLDTINKIATVDTSHFSHFALMGEVKDLIPPTTEVTITGDKGQDNWYRSNVTVELFGVDNESGIGLKYTLYTLNDSDWVTYESPLIFDQEGTHKITYQSFDKADNKEERKSISLFIDKTIPEARIYINQEKQDLEIVGIDNNQTTVERQSNINTKKKDDAIYLISDLAGNTIKLDVRERDKDKKDSVRIHSIQYNQDSPIELPDNKLVVEYKGKKDKRNVDEQRFEIKKEVKVRIKYNPKKNQSTITTRQEKQEKVKELKDDLILLQLETNQGKLEYSY